MDKKTEKNIEKNVIVAAFNVESEGYQALTELRQAAGGKTYIVSAAALIKKEHGACRYLDGFDTGFNTVDDALKGELIGMTIGILGGPLGVLLGGSYGALIGMAADSGDAALETSMLDQIAGKLGDDMVALVALAGEESPDELDAKLSAFDAVIARFDAEAVADEVEKAYETQAEMARHAMMELRKKKDEEFRKELEENMEILRKNFTK